MKYQDENNDLDFEQNEIVFAAKEILRQEEGAMPDNPGGFDRIFNSIDRQKPSVLKRIATYRLPFYQAASAAAILIAAFAIYLGDRSPASPEVSLVDTVYKEIIVEKPTIVEKPVYEEKVVYVYRAASDSAKSDASRPNGSDSSLPANVSSSIRLALGRVNGVGADEADSLPGFFSPVSDIRILQ